MSIKQVSVVLFHKYRSRFLETTVTQLLLVVALFPRPPTQWVIAAGWKRPCPCSGTSPAECRAGAAPSPALQGAPRAGGGAGRSRVPCPVLCVLCRALCPAPCRGRGSGPGGMPRVAALPVWGKGSGPFPASPGPWRPLVGVVPRRAGALRSFPAAVPASGAWRSPARSALPAGRCRRPALRAPAAPLLGKGKGAPLSGFGEPWGSSEQLWCLCS